MTKRFGKLLLKVRRLHFTLHKNECEVCEDWTQKGREDDIIAITQYMCEFFSETILQQQKNTLLGILITKILKKRLF